jgi:hypothetical protein
MLPRNQKQKIANKIYTPQKRKLPDLIASCHTSASQFVSPKKR